MEIKTVYIAKDGTEFEEKSECLAHEASLTSECDFIQLYDHNGEPIKWNPDNYDDMWNRLYFIVIEPHREEEAEEWWANSFGAMLDVNPFSEMDNDCAHGYLIITVTNRPFLPLTSQETIVGLFSTKFMMK